MASVHLRLAVAGKQRVSFRSRDAAQQMRRKRSARIAVHLPGPLGATCERQRVRCAESAWFCVAGRLRVVTGETFAIEDPIDRVAAVRFVSENVKSMGEHGPVCIGCADESTKVKTQERTDAPCHLSSASLFAHPSGKRNLVRKSASLISLMLSISRICSPSLRSLPVIESLYRMAGGRRLCARRSKSRLSRLP